MSTFFLVSNILLWIAVLLLAFLLMGTLRALGLLTWRLEQLQATAPIRLGRSGLKIGKKAPDFTMPSVDGGDYALHEFAGRKVLLVFTQSGCSPCKAIIPELNRLQDQGRYQVIVANNGEPEVTRRWAAEANSRVPVLIQERFDVSKRYEVFATPFAFLIDESGVITSKGLVGSRQHLGYVLTGAGNRPGHDDIDSEMNGAHEREVQEPFFQRR
jgi:methylamine dehydrogenase accessory protein MauD